MDRTVSTLSDRWHSMRDAKRVGRLDDQNHRLRTELRMTRSQLDREHDRQQETLDALNRASQRTTKVTAKPKVGLFRLVVVGGVAYVFGTRAGRERYEQIRGWASSAMDRFAESRRTMDTSSPGIGHKPNPITDSGIRPANVEGSRSA